MAVRSCYRSPVSSAAESRRRLRPAWPLSIAINWEAAGQRSGFWSWWCPLCWAYLQGSGASEVMPLPLPLKYLSLGVLVQLAQMVAFTQIPNHAGYIFIEQAWWVLLLFYPLATMLLCLIFRDQELRLKDQEGLASRSGVRHSGADHAALSDRHLASPDLAERPSRCLSGLQSAIRAILWRQRTGSCRQDRLRLRRPGACRFLSGQ
jgi:hypothetical protein